MQENNPQEMTFDKYKAVYENECPEYIDVPSKKLTMEWLDMQIKMRKVMQSMKDLYSVPLCWGEKKDKKYEFEIIESPSMRDPVCWLRPFLQIHRGIELLAELLDAELKLDGSELSLTYKGMRIIQVAEDEVH